jgi:predicted nucleotidyltransferase
MKDIENIKKIVISTLQDYQPVYIGIFGSFSRGEQKEGSDIDLLVKFKKPQSLLKLIGIENKISEQLGLKVDLVTEGALTNKRIKKSVEQDLQYIYTV